jgi:hypothetical protein
VNRPRAADDFETIRARVEELRRERAVNTSDQGTRSGKPPSGRGESDAERRRRERIEGSPPPWVPTIFVKRRGLDPSNLDVIPAEAGSTPPMHERLTGGSRPSPG